jgi:hypothetical protein
VIFDSAREFLYPSLGDTLPLQGYGYYSARYPELLRRVVEGALEQWKLVRSLEAMAQFTGIARLSQSRLPLRLSRKSPYTA